MSEFSSLMFAEERENSFFPANIIGPEIIPLMILDVLTAADHQLAHILAQFGVLQDASSINLCGLIVGKAC